MRWRNAVDLLSIECNKALGQTGSCSQVVTKDLPFKAAARLMLQQLANFLGLHRSPRDWLRAPLPTTDS